MTRLSLIVGSLALVLLGRLASLPAERPQTPPIDPADWPTYNRDVLGTRHNPVEKHLSRDNVAQLVEKWRYPPPLSLDLVGVISGTPVVVNGYVYFGTATLPAVYKLTPDGKRQWIYRPKNAALLPTSVVTSGLPDSGFANSPLVTADTVYIADVGGRLYALERATGKERWVVDTRAKPFPGAHASNCIFAAPILAADKLILAGGGFEHFAATHLGEKCCTGRGFVAALEPLTGKTLWKYEVGPEPRKFSKPVKIDGRVYHYGPSTSSVWCTPSYDATTGLITFGTDAHNSPREPTADDPRTYTKHSCAIIALDATTGKEKWVTQINPGDIWNYSHNTYDAKTGLYKDQSIGDTPKPYTLTIEGKPRRVVGAGCKNGVFYVLDALTGQILFHTPQYKGPPSNHPKDVPARMLALPGAAGGLQTGCATDGKAIYTNGMDMPLLGYNMQADKRYQPPIGGRVVCLSLDTQREFWRHERPRLKAVGGTPDKPAFTNVGDPVAAGIALANGVAFFTTQVSNQLVAIDTSTGKKLKEIPLGPVWCGPSVSRGRVYVGTGNLLFAPSDPQEAFFPKQPYGRLLCFGLPGRDEVDKLGSGTD
jgi:polyvinyl alcohol dehydrogenase (cytochrome)